jgi:hypothetical protein
VRLKVPELAYGIMAGMRIKTTTLGFWVALVTAIVVLPSVLILWHAATKAMSAAGTYDLFLLPFVGGELVIFAAAVGVAVLLQLGLLRRDPKAALLAIVVVACEYFVVIRVLLPNWPNNTFITNHVLPAIANPVVAALFMCSIAGVFYREFRSNQTYQALQQAQVTPQTTTDANTQGPGTA